MIYTITTGQLEKGTGKQQAALRGNAGLAPTLREMGIPDVPADIDCIRHGDIVDILT